MKNNNSAANASTWSLFGRHIRCINLSSRLDRRATSQATFTSLGIPVRYFITDKHPNGGAQGCYESHAAVVTEAYTQGAPYVMVFEDDIMANARCDFSVKLKEVQDFLTMTMGGGGGGWDILYVGIVPVNIIHSRSIRVAEHPSMYTTGGWGTHAYILNRQGMQKLVNLPYFGMPIDVLYKTYFRGVAIYPSLFYQDPAADSDIASPIVQTLQPALLQVGRALEWYAHRLGVPVSAVFSLLGACVLGGLVARTGLS